jgi:glycosyltransferase involved in cell wall biosynthesis
MKTYLDSPRVSVIVPNFNHALYIRERLESILKQTFQDFELIVLDDASTDESLQTINSILTGLPFRLNVNHSNSGSPCSQWLKGIAMSVGKYIWIAESDDCCEADFLEEMVNVMERDHCLSYCRTSSIDDQGHPTPENPYWPDCIDPKQWQSGFTMNRLEFNNRYMSTANCIPNASSVVFRKDQAISCLRISGLLKNLLYIGDWVFWHHYLCAATGTIHFDNRPLCYFRYHSSTTRELCTKESELRRFSEHSTALDHIASRSLSPLSWLKLGMNGAWDWIIYEYLRRLKPSLPERLLTRGLHGRLASSVWLRVLWSKTLREHYLAEIIRVNRRSLSAQCKHILKGLIPH